MEAEDPLMPGKVLAHDLEPLLLHSCQAAQESPARHGAQVLSRPGRRFSCLGARGGPARVLLRPIGQEDPEDSSRRGSGRSGPTPDPDPSPGIAYGEAFAPAEAHDALVKKRGAVKMVASAAESFVLQPGRGRPVGQGGV